MPAPGQPGPPMGLAGSAPVGHGPAVLHPDRDSGVPMQSRRTAAGAVGLLPGPRSGN